MSIRQRQRETERDTTEQSVEHEGTFVQKSCRKEIHLLDKGLLMGELVMFIVEEGLAGND